MAAYLRLLRPTILASSDDLRTLRRNNGGRWMWEISPLAGDYGARSESVVRKHKELSLAVDDRAGESKELQKSSDKDDGEESDRGSGRTTAITQAKVMTMDRGGYRGLEFGSEDPCLYL